MPPFVCSFPSFCFVHQHRPLQEQRRQRAVEEASIPRYYCNWLVGAMMWMLGRVQFCSVQV